jgi:myo-inositol-1(or 4)-monophosphatase
MHRKRLEICIGDVGGAKVTEHNVKSCDLLTLIDPLCEKMIQETLSSTFSDHDFLGEEDVPPLLARR